MVAKVMEASMKLRESECQSTRPKHEGLPFPFALATLSHTRSRKVVLLDKYTGIKWLSETHISSYAATTSS